MVQGYYRSLPHIFRGFKLDIHAPIQGRDIASLNVAHRQASLEEYRRVVDLAGEMHARALIVHLTPHDIPWHNGFSQMARAEQLAIALASVRALARYRDRHVPALQLMVEGLEYPKWWASTEEARAVLPAVKQLDPTVTSCVDVAHLWHNRYLNPETGMAEDFAAQLAVHLRVLDGLAPVGKIHLAGAYVWQREDGDAVHATHAVPGLAPWEVLRGGTGLFLDGPPPGFEGEWMALGPVLKVIGAFGRERGSWPPIAMEVHLSAIEAKMQLNAMVATILLRQKVAQVHE